MSFGRYLEFRELARDGVLDIPAGVDGAYLDFPGLGGGVEAGGEDLALGHVEDGDGCLAAPFVPDCRHAFLEGEEACAL